MYAVTESVLGAVVISVTLWVRQGSPTSCQLFIIFVNDLIKMIKNGAGIEGFLSWLRVLVLMDDTVLVATTRPNMIKKISIVQKYCDEYGMKMNLAIRIFFVIYCEQGDKEPLHVFGLTVHGRRLHNVCCKGTRDFKDPPRA